MPYCPSCEAEYRAGVTVCPSCNVALVDALDETGSSEDLVDVYRCYDAQLGERVLDLLREAGTAPMLRDRGSTAFPTTIGTTAERVVAVPAHEARQARRTLREALGDHVLTEEDGDILEGGAS